MKQNDSITRVVGFDPASTRNLGWSLIDYGNNGTVISIETGTFVMPVMSVQWRALWPICSLVDQFLAEQLPDIVVVEKTSSFQGGFITGQVSQCIGVILSVCGKYDLDVSFVLPTHVKKVITNSGKATKSQMKKGVLQYLKGLGIASVNFGSAHSVDATANILCWLIENKMDNK